MTETEVNFPELTPANVCGGDVTSALSSELDIQYLRSWIISLYRIGLTSNPESISCC